MPNISIEDYLSAIYKYRDESGKIKPNIIAEKLGISNAAVTDMLRKLSREDYVNYEKYRSVTLTEKGRAYARNMVRRHRIWEVFLNQVVGMPWDKVHDEAHRLEHSSSDELINRMEEMLEFPEYDPHGDPIPSKEGKVPKLKKNIPLTLLKEGEKGKVIRVNDFDEGFLVYIAEIGITLNELIEMKAVRNFDKSMLIQVGKKDRNISRKLAENVFVEVVKK
ncbi:MAG TPA: metal-dependent transcriptional regulator [Ignavibacteriaceae bacterium]|nr:metal-dependent transcriptional regulator [Ignavibacteriaceae bacterium]